MKYLVKCAKFCDLDYTRSKVFAIYAQELTILNYCFQCTNSLTVIKSMHCCGHDKG